MNKQDCKYVWEKSRGVFRVVVDTPEYNPGTKRTIHHYVTVGKAKEKGGEIEFGPKYRAIEKAGKDATGGGKAPKAKSVTLSGERLVLDRACSGSGLKKAVCRAFGKEMGAKALALAYYLIATGDALSNAAPWLGERGLAAVDAPRVSELLPLLGEEACSSFFRAWISAKAPGRTLCYDITSLSTYASGIDMAEFGYNRDREKWMKQINLAMVTDKETHMPLAFRTVNGSLSDVRTLDDTLNEFSGYGARPYGMVMDRGFWGKGKLEMLSGKGIKFMIPVPSSVKWAKELIKAKKNEVFLSDPLPDGDGGRTYGCTAHDPCGEGRRVWAHVYYSPSVETARKERFIRDYGERKKELQAGAPDERYRRFYDEHFTLSAHGKRVTDRRSLSDIVAEKDFGYWVLYTDMEKNAITALEDYRDRGFIEAGFDDIKGATDGRRLRVHYTKSIFGRIFLQFLAQTLRTWLRNSITAFPKDARKFASDPDALLARVRSYALVSYEGRYKPQYLAMTKGQRLIFEALGITEPDAFHDDEDNTEKLLS